MAYVVILASHLFLKVLVVFVGFMIYMLVLKLPGITMKKNVVFEHKLEACSL